MSFETVVSIVESAVGGVTTTVTPMTQAEYVAFMTPRWIARLQMLQRYGMHGYIEELAASFIGRGAAFQSAMAQMAAQEAAVTAAAADAAAVAAEGTLVAGAGTTVAAIAVPVVAMVAVGVALGAPYYQARQEAKEEGYASGFSHGFVCGLLKWPLHNTINLFWDNAVSRNPFDELLPTIRANAHNKGLLKGRLAGLAQPDRQKKAYLKGLHRLTTTSKAGWSARSDDWQERMRARQVQLSYVIELATAARRNGILKQG